MRSELLHVISVISNPMRWATRQTLFNNFIEHMKQSGVQLTIVECAFGHRPFRIFHSPDYNLIQVRTTSLAWVKENLINLGISRLPHDWRYVAWVDGDIQFRNPNWASETVDALQHYGVIQPWSDVYDLGPNGEHLYHWKSFAHQFWHRRPMGQGKGYTFPHPGYAWAATRESIERLGGLIDFAIAGAADHHMAYALIGHVDWSIPGKMNGGYVQALEQWQKRAMHHIQRRVGYLPITIEHSWHGSKNRRKYIERWDILTKNKFDPHTDIKHNSHRVIELAGNKPDLEHDLDVYFRQRNEDSNDVMS